MRQKNGKRVVNVNANKLKGKIVERGMTVGRLAQEVGMDRATMYRKLKDGSFTVKEAQLIGLALGLTKQDVMDIFFNDYVA